MREEEYRELMESIRDRLKDPIHRQLFVDIIKWKAVTGDAYVVNGMAEKLISEVSDRPTLQELQELFDETRTLRQMP